MNDKELLKDIQYLKANKDKIYKRQSAKRKAFLEDPANAQAVNNARLSISIARDLYEARKAKGLTQKELAELLNTCQSYIAEVENGKRNVTIETLERYAAACGKHIELKVV